MKKKKITYKKPTRHRTKKINNITLYGSLSFKMTQNLSSLFISLINLEAKVVFRYD